LHLGNALFALWVSGFSGTTKAQQSQTVYSYSVPAGGYAANGNLMEYMDGVTGHWTMQYDNLNRLHTASADPSLPGPYKGANLAWGYDSFGNRTSQTDPGNPSGTSLTFDTNNHLTSDGSGTAPTYDAAGNLRFFRDYAVAYDAENRICAVYDGTSTSNITQYLYDAEGRRVAKGHPAQPTTIPVCTTGGSDFQPTEKYILGQSGEQITELVTQPDGSDQWKHTNVYGGGQLIATYDQNGSQQLLHFNITDPLGTKRIQTSANGASELTCLSMPFGDGPPCIGTGQEATEQRYTGKERDQESGLDYFGARMYASTMGRWMSPDLINVTEERMMNPSSTLNKYAYGANNPLKYVDPDGQDITIFYESGVPGHIMMMAYDPNMSSAATRSFGPASSYSRGTLGSVATIVGLPVPATTKFDFDQLKTADDLRAHYASITIKTSPEVTQQVVQTLNSHSGDQKYTTFGYACASSCARILNQIKQFSNLCCKNALVPNAFFNNVYEQYGNGNAGTSMSGSAVFKPGVSYGGYQPGWNEFDVLSSLINPTTQKPTRNCTINVTPDGTSGDC